MIVLGTGLLRNKGLVDCSTSPMHISVRMGCGFPKGEGKTKINDSFYSICLGVYTHKTKKCFTVFLIR